LPASGRSCLGKCDSWGKMRRRVLPLPAGGREKGGGKMKSSKEKKKKRKKRSTSLSHPIQPGCLRENLNLNFGQLREERRQDPRREKDKGEGEYGGEEKKEKNLSSWIGQRVSKGKKILFHCMRDHLKRGEEVTRAKRIRVS